MQSDRYNQSITTCICGKQIRSTRATCGNEDCRQATFYRDAESKQCGKAFRKSKRSKKAPHDWCCRKCYLAWKSENADLHELQCAECGKAFNVSGAALRQKPCECCSKECADEFKRNRCVICNERVPAGTGRATCSDGCASEAMRRAQEQSLGFSLDDPWRESTARVMGTMSSRRSASRRAVTIDEWDRRCESAVSGLRIRIKRGVDRKRTKHSQVSDWETAVTKALAFIAYRLRWSQMDAWDRKCHSTATNGRKRREQYSKVSK